MEEFSNLLMELWKSDNHQATLDVADLMVFYFQTCENLVDNFQITSNKDKASSSCSLVNSLPFKSNFFKFIFHDHSMKIFIFINAV